MEELTGNQLDFLVFPNPFYEYTNIHVNNPNETYNLYIYDLNGKCVLSFINQTQKEIRLNKTFESGIYTLEIVNTNTSKRKLIIVE